MIKAIISLFAVWFFAKLFQRSYDLLRKETILRRKIVLCFTVAVSIFMMLEGTYFFAVGWEEFRGRDAPCWTWMLQDCDEK